MKKINSIILILPIFLTLLAALMYASGLNYYYGYLRAFGIPYGIFNIGINDILFFGGETLATYSYLKIEFLTAASLGVLFFLVFLEYFIDKLKISHYFKINSKKKTALSDVVCLFCFSMIFIMGFMFVFGKVIQLSSDYGEKMGRKHKTDFHKNLLLMKNNNKVRDADVFVFKMNDHGPDKVGYIIASKEDIFAVYTIEGLVFERLSDAGGYHVG